MAALFKLERLPFVYGQICHLPYSSAYVLQHKDCIEKRLAKVVDKITLLDHLMAAKKGVQEGTAFMNSFEQAVRLQGKKRKVESAVYGHIHEFNGKVPCESLCSMIFKSSHTDVSLRTRALDKALEIFQKSRAMKVLAEFETLDFSLADSQEMWAIGLRTLMEKVEKECLGGFVFAPPKSVEEVVQQFIAVFDQVPEDMRRRVLTIPLSGRVLKNSFPLYYILAAKNTEALKKVQAYLQVDDLTKSQNVMLLILATCDFQCCDLLLLRFPELKIAYKDSLAPHVAWSKEYVQRNDPHPTQATVDVLNAIEQFSKRLEA